MNSLLIANRGEIASRIIRTCRKMGIRTIAVFSDADQEAPFVGEADQAIRIGAGDPTESYLNIEKLITAARQSGAEAVHPGYGFLAENAAFARACQEAGLTWVGPHPEAIEAMGSKSRAKALMQQHQVPVIPGYQGEDQSQERLTKEAQQMGFPVLLKAAAGGGGKGMRIVHEASALPEAIEGAQREAQSAFGDAELIIEKYIASGRHIEFQIFGDQQGNILHLLERECSLQRRYQKVMEETPSPVMDDSLRQRMGEAAVRAAQAIRYDNAGTVEFIYDEKSGDFYFLEINTRLQVEHPVTEAVTGLDLVQMQIESAMGQPLRLKQEQVQGRGYALELRLYAEDAGRDFMPVTGQVLNFEVPLVEGLRVESAVQSGSEVSIFYDPMIAKLIVWDETRASVHRKMRYVLRHLRCQGLTTNQAFLLQLLEQEEVLQGQYDTHFIGDKLRSLAHPPQDAAAEKLLALAATLFRWQQREGQRGLLRALPSGWRNSFYQPQQEKWEVKEKEITLSYRYLGGTFEVYQEGEDTLQVRLAESGKNSLRLEVGDRQHLFWLAHAGDQYFVQHEQWGQAPLRLLARFPSAEKQQEAGSYQAPMPSQVVKVLAVAGQEVTAGDALLVLSSMKMENTLRASSDGVVAEVFVQEGQQVAAGEELVRVEEGKKE
jgi:acetyl/propionyl-CoA carboxylase alpha subunit